MKKSKEKVCRKLLYMLLWESLFIYMMEQSANWPLLLHINIWRNYTEHTVDDGGMEWTIISHSLYSINHQSGEFSGDASEGTYKAVE